MPPEVLENNSPSPSVSNKNQLLFVVLLFVLILLAAGLIYLGRKYPSAPSPVEGPAGLTEAEKAEILKSLQLPPNTPPLTEAEKAEILKSLQLPPNTPPLTETQKAEILKSLK